MQFGSIVVTDSFEARGLTRQDAQRHLSTVFLIGNLGGAAFAFFIGWLSDKVGNYRLLNLMNFLMACLTATMVLLISGGIENLGTGFDICLVLNSF